MKFRFSFMKYARFWVAVSLLVTVAGVVSLATQGLRLGIDYTGGLQLDLKFERADVTLEQVRQAVASSTGKEPIVQRAEVKGSGQGAEFLIQTPRLDEAGRAKLFADLEKALGKFERVAVSDVSGTIRDELVRDAVLAVGISAVLQIAYITFRFEFKQAVAAVVALLHDALIVLGLMSIFRVELGPPFVAAILTVIGYSIHDTIIVFDRIREHLRTPQGRSMPLPDLIDLSINETLSRTVNTVLTVQFTIVALLLWGGETTRDFALTLLFGITSGAYSSIFVAAALWMWWKLAEKARPRTRPVAAR